jgi:hypothetical protein
MRVMVVVKASKESEAGQMPSEQILRDMGKYNEELVNAGVMQAGEGLHPSSKGKRVKFSGTQRTVIDGPFAETKELIAGFWLWKVKNMDEAVAFREGIHARAARTGRAAARADQGQSLNVGSEQPLERNED